MTTLTAQDSIDKERIWETYELPKGAKVQIFVREEFWVEREVVAVFDKMDWGYWLWHEEDTDRPLIFNAKFQQIDEDCFSIYYEEDVKSK